jgi:FlaA1/EpsC-like NDP-sugar epimerase
MMPDPVSIATGRTTSLFADDLAATTRKIADAVRGRRLLVIGGAGSIGAATVRAVLAYDPAAIHIIDHDENGLTGLVRDLRSAGATKDSLDLQLMPLDYGASVARRFLESAGPYDVVLHFAALKHVRSEKHVASILQMLDTNVLKQQRLISWLNEIGAPQRYFAVSTDKAANPANFMGASKRLMEQLIFTRTCTPLGDAQRTSARFANVAFSAGSLLAGFGDRIRSRQPIAVPRDTRRFFVSIGEAAEICVLALAALPDGYLAVPRTEGNLDLRELTPIAEAFVMHAGYTPSFYDDEPSARSAIPSDVSRGRWPILRTPRDTDGEKEHEVFIGRGERTSEVGLDALLGVPQTGIDHSTLESTLDALRDLVDHPATAVNRSDLVEIMRRAVPEFDPIQSGRTLDNRM